MTVPVLLHAANVAHAAAVSIVTSVPSTSYVLFEIGSTACVGPVMLRNAAWSGSHVYLHHHCAMLIRHAGHPPACRLPKATPMPMKFAKSACIWLFEQHTSVYMGHTLRKAGPKYGDGVKLSTDVFAPVRDRGRHPGSDGPIVQSCVITHVEEDDAMKERRRERAAATAMIDPANTACGR